MADFDLIIRGGWVVTESDIQRLDIAIADEKVVSLAPELTGTASSEIDATGLHIFPGVLDAHVHFNEPGRADWEGIETGSQALAAGGGTMFFDMPLNAHPPTIDAEAFDLKLAAAQKKSVTDFALWGGLVPGNVDRLEELAERGVVGFKAFMSNSGIEDFQSVDDTTLRDGMRKAAQLNLPVAVHAESETMTSRLSAEMLAKGKTSIRNYLDSRPIAAELDAIQRAIDIAGETGCALHIVHVSSAAGVALVAEAKRKGVDVTCETCPHYLVLTDTDVERIGAVAKCAPPIRSAEEQEKLWREVLNGNVDTIGSDHSPAPPSMKTDKNFFKVWGGISGVQHTLPLLLTRSSRGKSVREKVRPHPNPLPQEREPGSGQSLLTSAATNVARLLSVNVAKRFRLPSRKGTIALGCDADLAIVKLDEKFEVHTSDLFYRHQQTPYAGMHLRGRIVRTLLRGTTIFADGKIVAKPAGRLVKPAR
jgi:allantoinase